MERSMHKSKRLTRKFWSEAFAYVADLSNRSLVRSVWGKTPQKAWSCRKLRISNLRVFRSITHVCVPDERRTKLDGKSKKLIFIGCANNFEEYKLYNPNNEKIVIN